MKPLFRKPYRILGVSIGLMGWAGLTKLFWPMWPAYATGFLFVVCFIQLGIDVFGPTEPPVKS